MAVRAWRLSCCWLSNILFFKQPDNTPYVQKDLRRHKTAKLNTSYCRSKTVEGTRSRYSLTTSLGFGKKDEKTLLVLPWTVVVSAQVRQSKHTIFNPSQWSEKYPYAIKWLKFMIYRIRIFIKIFQIMKGRSTKKECVLYI